MSCVAWFLQDRTGALHTTTVSAKSNPNRSSEARAPPTSSAGAAAAGPAAAAPQLPRNAETSTSSKSETTPTAPPKDPPSPPRPPGGRGQTLREQAEEHEAEMRRREAERNRRQLRTILSHARVVRRCLQFATKVLDRYDVSPIS